MEALVIARHGVYDDSYNLSPRGAEQMKALAERLKPTIGSRKVIVLASSVSRGRASGDVMGEVLGCPVEHHEVLWSEKDHPENLEKATELIMSKGADHDVVIIVTHLEYTERLPSYVGEHVMGGVKFGYVEITKGSAYIMDFNAKTCVRA